MPSVSALTRGFVCGVILVFIAQTSPARVPAPTAERESRLSSSKPHPAYCAANHDVGKLGLTISNRAQIGRGYLRESLDCFTGEPLVSGEYPLGSNNKYLFAGALWVGAIVGNDTLVSTGADGWYRGLEYHPDNPPFGYLQPLSNREDSPLFSPDALSPQDYIAVFTDTFTDSLEGLEPDEVDNRPHVPLPLEVTQKSHAWDFPLAEDFVLLEYWLKNIGEEELREVYAGLWIDGDVAADGHGTGARDDMVGSLRSFEVNLGACTTSVPRLTGWTIDNDGDYNVWWDDEKVLHVTGLTLLSTPALDSQVAFNWWVSNANPSLDYGPQTWENLRPFYTGGLGTPAGDRAKYFIMKNRELDFDLPFTGTIDSANPTWVPPPPPQVLTWSYGTDTRFLISTGPYSIPAGDSIPLHFAYVGGENVHRDSLNFEQNMMLDYRPDVYMANLDFTDFQKNIAHAYWLYDHPGIDTDSDGYFGKFIVCNGDTVFYEGDGVPDLRPGTKAPHHAFARLYPPDDSHIAPNALEFTWNSCPSLVPITGYDFTLKGGNVEVTFEDIADTTIGIDLPQYVQFTGPVEVEWTVSASYKPWTFVPVNGRGNFTVDFPTDASDPDDPGLPVAFALEQNYPNPFNPSTEISFVLPRAERVTLEIFNITGQRVATVLTADLAAGEHVVTWDGTSAGGSLVASGVYFYKLQAGEYTATKKMILAR